MDQFGPSVESYNAFSAREEGFKLGALDVVGDDEGLKLEVLVGIFAEGGSFFRNIKAVIAHDTATAAMTIIPNINKVRPYHGVGFSSIGLSFTTIASTIILVPKMSLLSSTSVATANP